MRFEDGINSNPETMTLVDNSNNDLRSVYCYNVRDISRQHQGRDIEKVCTDTVYCIIHKKK
jgi:hypothetical protein